MRHDDNKSGTPKRFCSNCGCYRQAVSKKKVVDFQVCGETLVCPFCGTNLDDAKIEKANSALNGLFVEKPKSDSKPSVLSIFTDANKDKSPTKDDILSGPEPADDNSIRFLDNAKEAHFCKDCEFFMFHPYKSYCCKHEKDVSPTDDCNSFSQRK